MPANAYGLAVRSIISGEVNFLSNTVKCLLLTSSYTPNQDTHRYRSDLTNELAATGGYTAGGVTLGSKTVAYDNASNTLTLDSADPEWASLTASAVRYAVFYVDTGTASTSPLLSYINFGADQAPASQTFRITLPATGILQFVVA